MILWLDSDNCKRSLKCHLVQKTETCQSYKHPQATLKILAFELSPHPPFEFSVTFLGVSMGTAYLNPGTRLSILAVSILSNNLTQFY